MRSVTEVTSRPVSSIAVVLLESETASRLVTALSSVSDDFVNIAVLSVLVQLR